MLSATSIKNKILIFALLATLVPSAGLGLLLFWQYRVIIADNVTHQLRTLASDASRELEFWLGKQVDGLRTVAGSETVINGITPPSVPPSGRALQSTQVLSHYLRLVQDKLDPLLELTVLDARGQVVASSAEQPVPMVLPNPWPPSAATQGVLIDLPHDDAHGDATLTLAVPVLSLDDQILGVLMALVDLRTVQSRLNYIANRSPGDVALVDLRGRVLLDTRGDLTSEPSLLEPEILQRLRTQAGQPTTFEGHRHGQVLGLAEEPGKLPVLVVAERDREEIYRAWVVFRNLFLSLLGGLTLLVAVAGWGMGRSIVKPLKRLSRAADAIAGGDLNVELPVVRGDEIGHLTQVFNQMTNNLRRSHEEVEAASHVLQQQNELLETLSVTDGLTGLYNRKKLDDILAQQLERFSRNQRPFAVLLLDIDHFKTVNDTYGHLAGDEILKNTAKTLSQSIRSVDYAARYGGEEFAIVLPETSTHTARELAERIRHQIERARCQFDGQSLTITLSIGVAAVRDDDETAQAVIGRADQMLYEAKHAGRNRVHCAD